MRFSLIKAAVLSLMLTVLVVNGYLIAAEGESGPVITEDEEFLPAPQKAEVMSEYENEAFLKIPDKPGKAIAPEPLAVADVPVSEASSVSVEGEVKTTEVPEKPDAEVKDFSAMQGKKTGGKGFFNIFRRKTTSPLTKNIEATPTKEVAIVAEKKSEIPVVKNTAITKKPFWRKLAVWKKTPITSEQPIAADASVKPAEKQVKPVKKRWWRSSGKKKSSRKRKRTAKQGKIPMPNVEEKKKIDELIAVIKNSTDYAKQLDAKKQLCAMGQIASVDAESLLIHHDPIVQILGVLILRETKGPTAYAKLVELLNHENPRLRHKASMSLVKMTGNSEIKYHYNDVKNNRLMAAKAWSDYLMKNSMIYAEIKTGYQAPATAGNLQQQGMSLHDAKIEEWRQLARIQKIKPGDNKSSKAAERSIAQDSRFTLFRKNRNLKKAKTKHKPTSLWDMVRSKDRTEGSIWDRMRKKKKKGVAKRDKITFWRQAQQKKASVFDNVRAVGRNMKSGGSIWTRIGYAGQHEDRKAEEQVEMEIPNQEKD